MGGSDTMINIEPFEESDNLFIELWCLYIRQREIVLQS